MGFVGDFFNHITALVRNDSRASQMVRMVEICLIVRVFSGNQGVFVVIINCVKVAGGVLGADDLVVKVFIAYWPGVWLVWA